jgi:hypothetical protein
LGSKSGKFVVGLTELNGQQWLVAIGLAAGLVLVDEIVKVFLRRMDQTQQALEPQEVRA